jgi:hypothetical protein
MQLEHVALPLGLGVIAQLLQHLWHCQPGPLGGCQANTVTLEVLSKAPNNVQDIALHALTLRLAVPNWQFTHPAHHGDRHPELRLDLY